MNIELQKAVHNINATIDSERAEFFYRWKDYSYGDDAISDIEYKEEEAFISGLEHALTLINGGN